MRTATIDRTYTVPANDEVPNLIVNEDYKRCPFNAIGQMLVNISAEGVRYELSVNGRVITEQNDSRVEPSPGVTLVPDDVHVEQFYCPEGGDVRVRGVNSSGAPVDINVRLTFTETDVAHPPEVNIVRGPITCPAADDDGGVIENVLEGLLGEFPRVDSLMSTYFSAADPGLEVSVLVNMTQVAPPVKVNATSRVPIDPDDITMENIEVPAKQRVKIRVKNTTGDAIDFSFHVRQQELTW